jgi:orotidine-5'-phosphate decarboxylase
MTKLNAKDRIIVALDSPRLDEALAWVRDLAPYAGYFKVGLELLTAHGAPEVVQKIHQLGGRLFFDGKFNDIPNTIAGATRSVAKLGVAMFDVHASCGEESMKAAVAHKGTSIALAVTVLTSIDDSTSRSIFGGPPSEKVVQFAKLAAKSGMDGIVCSPQELELLATFPELAKLRRVTPGIRPAWAATGDQKRILGPADAVKRGATHLVIGRPITSPPAEVGGPVEAIKKILAELETA